MIDSAKRHGVTLADAIYVIEHARQRIVLRDDPEKLLHIGFDTLGRPREVITDTWRDDSRVIIHADTLTPSYRRYLC